MSEETKAKYVVVTKFAHFSVGEVLELTVPCPSAAEAHVKLYVEPKVDKEESTPKKGKKAE